MVWMLQLPKVKTAQYLPTEEWLRSSLHRKECRYVLPRDGSRNIHAWKQPIRQGHTTRDKRHREVTKDEWVPGAGKGPRRGKMASGKVKTDTDDGRGGWDYVPEGRVAHLSASIPGVPPWTSSNTLAFIAGHLNHQLRNHFSPYLGF